MMMHRGITVPMEVDLRKLLFNSQRDVLIRSNSDELVTWEHLEHKVVVLHFDLLTPDYTSTWLTTAPLSDIYTQLLSDAAPFEVVFVAVGDATEDVFHHMFSSMPPWLAIPFSDSSARDHLATQFIGGGALHSPSSVVISETGVILQHNATSLFQTFGVEGYPFSNERINDLIFKDDAARDRPSLKALLASPHRDYLINNQGHKVHISDLESKTVALYLYESGCTKALTARLRDAYKCLVEEEKKKFEVVLVYIHDSWNTLGSTNAESFMKDFGTMPWLSLPFKDPNCKKVQRVVRYPFEFGGPQPDSSLVIVGPFGKFFEPFGASDVLMTFGSPAYPFTRETAFYLQVRNIKKLKLGMLWDPKDVFIRGCMNQATYEYTYEEVLFSDIVGKGVIVFSDAVRNELYLRFKIKLEEVYKRKKGKMDEFEVIHIASKKGEEVPWLTLHPNYPYKDSAVRNILHDTFHYGYGLLAFDRDGKVVRATSNPVLERDDEFPFSYGRLEKEVGFDLIQRFGWDFWG